MILAAIGIGGYVGIAVAGAVLIVLLALGVRASARAVKQPTMEPRDYPLDKEAITEHLAEALRYETISMVDQFKGRDEPFLGLRKWILETYPHLAKEAELTIIADYSLVFRLEGTDPDLLPCAFLSHQDVVPAPDKGWDYPPFGGVLGEDGYLYSRGALDMKDHLVAVLEGVEYWLKQGKRFERTIYLCFGHDEEPGQSLDGAPNIVKYFQEQGIRLEFVLDEGGSIIEGKQLFAKGYVAAIGATEKGMGDLEIVVHQEGGHASRPMYPSANGILADVIRRIEHHPMPSRMTPILKDTFVALSGATSPVFKYVLANSDVFAPLLKLVLSKASPVTNALVRTTLATTVLWGSDARNTIANEVKVNVNFRTLTGETAQDVVKHLEKILKKYIRKGQVTINLLAHSDPSPASKCDGECFEALTASIRETFEDTTVIPYVFLGATDSRFYTPICDRVYRFGPVVMGWDDESRFHGLNERIHPDKLTRAVRFFVTYLDNSCHVVD